MSEFVWGGRKDESRAARRPRLPLTLPPPLTRTAFRRPVTLPLARTLAELRWPQFPDEPQSWAGRYFFLIEISSMSKTNMPAGMPGCGGGSP